MNKYKPHVYVIPEDDRDRQIAQGFVLHDQVKDANIQVLPVAGGWGKVLDTFCSEYIQVLHNFKEAHVVMLIDFDDRIADRRARIEKEIPEDCKGRVFVLGSKDDPETLKRTIPWDSEKAETPNTGFERIGWDLADDCCGNETTHWNHEQLFHNDGERQRLAEIVKPFLF